MQNTVVELGNWSCSCSSTTDFRTVPRTDDKLLSRPDSCKLVYMLMLMVVSFLFYHSMSRDLDSDSQKVVVRINLNWTMGNWIFYKGLNISPGMDKTSKLQHEKEETKVSWISFLKGSSTFLTQWHQ